LSHPRPLTTYRYKRRIYAVARKKVAGLLLVSSGGHFFGVRKMQSILRRFLIIAGAFLTITFAPSGPTQAATISFDGSHNVTGIIGLDVSGSFFDIAFIARGTGDSYDTAYAVPVAYSNAEAVAIAIVALLNAEMPNIPDIADTNPAGSISGFVIPYSAVAPPDVEVYYADHVLNDGINDYSSPQYTSFSTSDAIISSYAWTLVTPTAVPLPGALPLFATGLGALGLLGWRRKKKAAALAA
jgi:hypothetical protein